MTYVYEFVGGPLNGAILNEVDAELFSEGHTEDLTAIRNAGGTVHREELDNQPTFHGYLGPMWGSTRVIDSKEVAVMRYETQEVYNELCL